MDVLNPHKLCSISSALGGALGVMFYYSVPYAVRYAHINPLSTLGTILSYIMILPFLFIYPVFSYAFYNIPLYFMNLNSASFRE